MTEVENFICFLSMLALLQGSHSGIDWQTDQEFIDLENMELMDKRVTAVVNDALPEFEELLLPSQHVTLEGYDNMMQQWKDEARRMDDDVCAFDSNQESHNWPRIRGLTQSQAAIRQGKLSCLIGHGTRWDPELNRPLLAANLLSCHGYPV